MPWGSQGGYPYPIMLCNISQNAMGQLGGYPARSSRRGTLPGPAGGVPWPGGVPCQVQPGGYPGRGVPWLGGYPGWGGTLARGYPGWGGTLARGATLAGGGTQLGQHREYLLHGGRYASCVHAGGLSCWTIIVTEVINTLSKWVPQLQQSPENRWWICTLYNAVQLFYTYSKR